MNNKENEKILYKYFNTCNVVKNERILLKIRDMYMSIDTVEIIHHKPQVYNYIPELSTSSDKCIVASGYIYDPSNHYKNRTECCVRFTPLINMSRVSICFYDTAVHKDQSVKLNIPKELNLDDWIMTFSCLHEEINFVNKISRIHKISSYIFHHTYLGIS